MPEGIPEPPRRATAWACLTYALATLTLAWPALRGQFLVNPVSDQYIGGFPVRHFAATMLRATGEYPLWNPYLFGGMPYVASMNGDLFYPTFLLRLLLPIDVGMTWGFILHLFLAGLFTYWFLRAVGLSFAGALIGGLAFMLSGQIASLASPGHDGKLFIAALLPAMLLCLTWGIRDGKRWAWGLLALVSGLGVLTPHPQLYQYMLLGSAAYALFLVFDPQLRAAGRPRVAPLAYGLAAILLGWLIGAIQFAPVLEYIDWSPRAGGKGWEHAVSYSMPPEELINTYLPQFSGILQQYWGRNVIHFHSEYIGASVLVLAGAGLGWGRRRESWFWIGVLIVSLLWALGGYTPFYRLVYALVPGAKFFRAPSTIFFISAFAVAVLAGRGTDRLFASGWTPRYLIGWLVAAVVVGVLAMSGALREAFAGLVLELRLDRFYDPELQRSISLGALRSGAVVLLIAAVAHVRSLGRVRALPLLAGLALLVVGDLWSVERRYWQFSAPASEIYASDAIIDHINAQPEPGRVFATQLGGQRDAFLGGDAYMVHRLRLVTGYHGNQIGRYDRLLGGADWSNLLNPAFLWMANVRWFVYDDSLPLAPSLERVMGPVRNAAGTPTWLFRVRGENPAAWVVPARMKQPDDVAEQALNDQRFPVRSIVLFPPEAAVETQALNSVPPPLPLTARVPVYEPGHIVVELDAPAPEGATLAVSENYYPGWTATVDGRPGEVYRANLSLMGVPLPTGARRVELQFASPRYTLGKWLTIAAIFIALAWSVWGTLAQRKAGDA